MLIPHGAGNIGSLMELFHQAGYFPKIAEWPDQLKDIGMAVIPGVGASGSAMAHLRATGFSDAIMRMNQRQQPILGICVGAQIMFERLWENECSGLGLLQGEVVRINGGTFNNGWCDIKLKMQPYEKGQSKVPPLLLKTAAKTFYFNHGYQIDTFTPMQESAYTSDRNKLLAYFVQNNLCGIQFHPEKSQAAGVSFLANTMKHYGL